MKTQSHKVGRSVAIVVATLMVWQTAIPSARANHPSPLPDTMNTAANNYTINFTNDNPYNPAAPAPGFDMNFMPDAQAQNMANALSNGNAASAGNPNGYHDGYTNLGFLAPNFGGANRPVFTFDCGAHGGCDSGNAPADRINMPATGYIDKAENCIRVVLGHELFHHVQYAYITFGNWPAWGGDPVEGTARLMQDKIFSDLDGSGGCITYKGEVNNYLGNPNRTLFGLSYTTALFWNYLMERFGTVAQEPQIGVDFITRFWQNAQTNNGSPDFPGTLRETIQDFDVGATLENVFHDFTVANYAKDLDVSLLDDAARYKYRDEVGADKYNAVTTTWDGGLPPQRGPQADSVVRWGAKYFVARPVDCSQGVIGFLSDGDRAAYSLMSVNKSNQVEQIYKSQTTHFARAMLYRRTAPISRLVAVVAGLNDAANFTYTFACGGARLEIIDPLNTRPAYVGSLNSPDRFLLRLNVTGPDALGTPSVEGLAPSDFNVFVGDPAVATNRATVLSGSYVQGQYWLAVQAPSKAPGSPDTYPLFVQLGDIASAAQQNAVIYQQRILDQVLVIDRSGSMLAPASSPKIVAARNAASLYVDAARTTDKVGVVSFAGDNIEPNDDATLNAQLRTMSDPNRTAAKTAVAGVAANGFTSIGDGLKKGAAEFPVRGNPVGEDWLVLLSDGMQNEADFYSSVKPSLLAAGIKVNTIALGPYTDQALLQQIASDTGGTYYYVDVGTGGAAAAAASTTAPSTDGIASAAAATASSLLPNALGDAYALANEHTLRHQRLWEDAATVGSPLVRTVQVGQGGIADALFSFNWTDGADRLDVTITDPNGVALQHGVNGVEIRNEPTHIVYRVPAMIGGSWTVALSPLNGAPQYLGILSGLDQQGAQMTMYFAQSPESKSVPAGTFLRGLPMPILTTLLDKKGPVTGAAVYASVEHPDGGVIRLPLLDDGNHGDGVADDGVYGNRLHAHDSRQPQQPGR